MRKWNAKDRALAAILAAPFAAVLAVRGGSRRRRDVDGNGRTACGAI
jgi:hypothetical protein